jgi:hypothetical protein
MGEPVETVSRRRFWWWIGLAAVALMLGCWLSSGTLTPYGTEGVGRCRYRINGDYRHFRAVFAMLDGHPPQDWNFSVVLRRILHPVLAYPWVKVFGFALGGLLFNVFSHVLALVGLALAIRRYFDARAAILVCWLFASYPGYAYWVGLPYSYAFIVPGSIVCMIALLWVHQRPSLARCASAACIIGFIALGYDLLPAFGGALLLLLLLQRRWLGLAVALPILAAWAVFIGRGLPAIFGFPTLNTNTQVYISVLDAYRDAWHRLDGWGALLAELPGIFASDFLFSAFVFFPILLLWLVAWRLRWRTNPVIHRVALVIMLSELATFLFLNLAPPYESDWQLRGAWIPRLYQPWFVAVLVVVAATSIAWRQRRRHRLLVWSVAVIAALDGAVIAGPFIGLTSLYASVNYHFYQLPGHDRNAELLHELGRRPYGICE